MRPRQPSLFKLPPSKELSSVQRTRALELLKALIKEAMSAPEAGSESVDNQEADDD